MARQLHGPVKWLPLRKKTGTHWNHQVSYCFSISVFCFLWISPTLGFHTVVTWGLLPLLRSDPVGIYAHTPIRTCPLGTCPSQTPELRPRVLDVWTDVDLYHMATPGGAGKTPPRIYHLGLGKEEYIKETVVRRMGNEDNKSKKCLSTTSCNQYLCADWMFVLP